MNKRVLSLTLLLACFSLVMQLKAGLSSRLTPAGYLRKRRQARNWPSMRQMGEWMDRGRDSSYMECERHAGTVR